MSKPVDFCKFFFVVVVVCFNFRYLAIEHFEAFHQGPSIGNFRDFLNTSEDSAEIVQPLVASSTILRDSSSSFNSNLNIG